MVEDLIVTAEYHQYYLADAQDRSDYAECDRTIDGILAPLQTVMRICSGVTDGDVHVQASVLEIPPPPPQNEAGHIASETDLELPSGIAELSHFDSGIAARFPITPGKSVLVRVRVEVSGRDEATRDSTVPELHRITMWPVTAPAPRWRTAEIDSIGAALQVVVPPSPTDAP